MIVTEGEFQRRRAGDAPCLLMSVTIAAGCMCRWWWCWCSDCNDLPWLASSRSSISSHDLAAMPLSSSGGNPAIHRGEVVPGSGHHRERREWKRRRRRSKEMAMLWWTALKRSLSCKSQGSRDVIKRDDDSRSGSGSGSAREFKHKKPSSSMPRSGCSRSISNLRDVVFHSARFQAPAPAPPAARGKCDSPMSVESGDVLNAVTHDVLLAAAGPASGRDDLRAGAAPGLAAWDIGAVPPFAHSPCLMRSATGGARLSQRKSPLRLGAGVYGDAGSPLPAWASCGEVAVRCNRCDGLFPSDNALESHHLVSHAVTEVAEDETASKVVELIYSVGWPNSEAALDRIERVVKVHSMERRVDRFKEYVEEVKGRAARLPNSGKHPRCVADGNELLQFHGTTISCSLGAGGSHSVCTSSLCNVCRIIRYGFSRNGGVGVFTTSTSKHALDCLQETGAAGGGGGEDGPADGGVKHALFVCRVIAGRIHRPLEKLQQNVAVQPGFDSVAGQVGDDSSIEELYLLNPSAILPCFVVICKA